MRYLLYVLILLLFPCFVFAQNKADCESYHEGYIEYDENDLFKGVVLYREGNTQIEYNTNDGTYMVLRIEWQSPCEYTIKSMNSNWDKAEPTFGETLEVKVTKANAKYYKYSVNFEVQGEYVTLRGTMNRLEKKKVPKKVRKEIKKILETKKDVQEYPVKT